MRRVCPKKVYPLSYRHPGEEMEPERFHQRGYTGAMSDMSSQLDQASGSARPAGGVFVGRQREIDALSSALDDALAGHGGW